jgi:hypothetical protein
MSQRQPLNRPASLVPVPMPLGFHHNTRMDISSSVFIPPLLIFRQSGQHIKLQACYRNEAVPLRVTPSPVAHKVV